MGVCGLSPQWDPRAEPLVRLSGDEAPLKPGGEAPLKLKAFWQSCAEFLLKYIVLLIFVLCSHVALKAVLATAYDRKGEGAIQRHGRIAPPPGSTSGQTNRQPKRTLELLTCALT